MGGRSILAECHDGATKLSHEMHCAGSSHLRLPLHLQSRGNHQVVSRQIFKSTSERDRTRRVRVTAVTVEQLCSDQGKGLGLKRRFPVLLLPGGISRLKNPVPRNSSELAGFTCIATAAARSLRWCSLQNSTKRCLFLCLKAGG